MDGVSSSYELPLATVALDMHAASEPVGRAAAHERNGLQAMSSPAHVAPRQQFLKLSDFAAVAYFS
jgi:hypothetical protein